MSNIRSNNIRPFRKLKGFNQLHLARELDVYQSEVSDIEMGKRVPNVYLAMKLAKVLDRDVRELFPL